MMTTALRTFYQQEGDRGRKREVTAALLGAPADRPLWHLPGGRAPSADAYYVDDQDVLYACVEFKRRRTPAQFTTVTHLDDSRHTALTDSRGRMDPLTQAIFAAAQGRRRDWHPQEGDTCEDRTHTQGRRRPPGTGPRLHRCALAQIDLYRAVGRCPPDVKRIPDAGQVLWLLVADDEKTPHERYQGSALSADCWVTRTWDDVLDRIAADTVLQRTPSVQTLVAVLDVARNA
jgi:hypothetical protein